MKLRHGLARVQSNDSPWVPMGIHSSESSFNMTPGIIDLKKETVRRGHTMNSAIERLLSLRVVDIMAKRVVTVSPEQSMADAASLLLKSKVSGAPVVDSRGHCVGILSATDYVRREGEAHRQQDDVAAGLVRQSMSPAVETIAEEATLMEAARKLCSLHIHRLPVVADDGRVVGWISSLDVVAAMINAIEE